MRNLKRVLLVIAAFGSITLFTACGNSATNANSQSQAQCAATAGNVWNTTTNSCTVNSSGVLANQTATTCSQQPGYTWNPSTNTCMQTTNNTQHSPYQGQCQYGLVEVAVQGQYACLPQGQCYTGYGYGTWGGQPYCFPAAVSY